MSTRKTQALNTRIVSQTSDLPFNSNTGEHELEDGTVYRFDGFVTSTSPIQLAPNSPLVGGHAGVDGFIHTGGGTAIKGTDSNVFMRNMYGHAPGGTLFDVSGNTTTETLIQSCSFSDAAGLGNMADLGMFAGFRVPTFKSCNFENFDSGLVFDSNGNGNGPVKVLLDGGPLETFHLELPPLRSPTPPTRT